MNNDIALSSQINACLGIDLYRRAIAHRYQTVSLNQQHTGRAGFAIVSITSVSHAYAGPIQSGTPTH